MSPNKINENSLMLNIQSLKFLNCFMNLFSVCSNQNSKKVHILWLAGLSLKSLLICRPHLLFPSPFPSLSFHFICWRNWIIYPVALLHCVFYRLHLLHCLTCLSNFLYFLEMDLEAWSDPGLILFGRNTSEMCVYAH